MKLIFISYRRQVGNHASGRIADRLMQHYGRSAVFRDLIGIQEGTTFRDRILATISASDLVLATITRNYETRIDAPDDFVRLEVEYALKEGIPILPVLVDDTTMPELEHLPSSIRPMAGLQSARVRDSDFDSDIERLITTIDAYENRKRIDIPTPAAGEPVTAEHLVLRHSSWRMLKLDAQYGHQVYGFAVVLDGDPSVVRRVDSVLYLLPPAWPSSESPKRVRRDTAQFHFTNIAWSDLVVRARVRVDDQSEPVFLSAFVRLTEAGPRLGPPTGG